MFPSTRERETISKQALPELTIKAKFHRDLNGFQSSYTGSIPKNGEVVAIYEWKFYIIRSELNAMEVMYES